MKQYFDWACMILFVSLSATVLSATAYFAIKELVRIIRKKKAGPDRDELDSKEPEKKSGHMSIVEILSSKTSLVAIEIAKAAWMSLIIISLLILSCISSSLLLIAFILKKAALTIIKNAEQINENYEKFKTIMLFPMYSLTILPVFDANIDSEKSD